GTGREKGDLGFGGASLGDGDGTEGLLGTKPGFSDWINSQGRGPLRLEGPAARAAAAGPGHTDLPRQGPRGPLPDRARRAARAAMGLGAASGSAGGRSGPRASKSGARGLGAGGPSRRRPRRDPPVRASRSPAPASPGGARSQALGPAAGEMEVPAGNDGSLTRRRAPGLRRHRPERKEPHLGPPARRPRG